jgi:preprotein translocase subunit SecE
MFAKIVNFLKEVKMEMKKINWPDKQKTIKYTMVVLGISLVISIYLGGLDFLFTFLLRTFIL